MIQLKIWKSIYKESIDFKNADELVSWLNTLVVPKRKPSDISAIEHSIIVDLVKIVNDPQYKFNIDFRNALLMNKITQLRLNKEEYEEIYSGVKNQPQIIKGKYAIYKHNDVGSYKRFLENIDNIENLFKSLKGYHKLALKNLTVEFVASSDMKTAAQYKSHKKIIWINPLSKRVGNTFEEYGSLRYIVVHELGHKFLEEHPQSWNISDPSLYTTDYSKRDTMTGEETFAELFAISNWKEKYSKYKIQIERFEKLLEY